MPKKAFGEIRGVKAKLALGINLRLQGNRTHTKREERNPVSLAQLYSNCDSQ